MWAWFADAVAGVGLLVFIGSAFVLASGLPAIVGNP
jgi:hypothetical protein